MFTRLAHWFGFASRRASWRGEVTGGATTFLTMAYIVFVQPAVLAQAGMDFGAVMAATCISAALATLLMGLGANYPIALAPGMGENFFFVYGAVMVSGLHWSEALGAVFYAGLLFLVLSVVRVRETILAAIPDSLKTATGIGVGLFIAFIGLMNAGIVTRGSGTLVALGALDEPSALLSLTGLLLTSALLVRGIPGAIFWGLIATGALAAASGVIAITGIVGAPPSMAPLFGQLDWTPHWSADFLAIVFVFLFMDVFDTVGTLAAVGMQGGFFINGRLPRANRAFLADSLGTLTGAVLGTSSVTSYIESSAGIAAGARTGAANLVTAAGFLLAMFFLPLVEAIGGGVSTADGGTLYPVTAPALILVGTMMVRLARQIPWDDFTEAVPAFLIVVGIPLTLSIADGLSLGFMFYPVLKLLTGRRRDIHPAMFGLALAAVARYFFI